MIKRIDKTKLKQNNVDQLVIELHILSNIEHPNIIKLNSLIEDPQNIYMILDYYEMDLFHFLNTKSKPTEAQAKLFLQEITQGLQQLHLFGVFHDDIKMENIYLVENRDIIQKTTQTTKTIKTLNTTSLTNDTEYHIVIGDFSFSKLVNQRIYQSIDSIIYSNPGYIAPEKFYEQFIITEQSLKADIFSLGCIFYILIFGFMPFEGGNAKELFKANKYGTPKIANPLTKSISPECIKQWPFKKQE